MGACWRRLPLQALQCRSSQLWQGWLAAVAVVVVVLLRRLLLLPQQLP